jgi:hypothetical protein
MKLSYPRKKETSFDGVANMHGANSWTKRFHECYSVIALAIVIAGMRSVQAQSLHYTEGPITMMSTKTNRVKRRLATQPANQRYCSHSSFVFSMVVSRYPSLGITPKAKRNPLDRTNMLPRGLGNRAKSAAFAFTSRTHSDAKRSKQSPIITIENGAERTTLMDST